MSTVDQVNQAFAGAAARPLKGILRYTTDPIVSHDIIGDPSSCIFDAQLTQVQDHLVKVSVGTTTSGATPAAWSI